MNDLKTRILGLVKDELVEIEAEALVVPADEPAD